jgi:mRNA interferase RelE/StbE
LVYRIEYKSSVSHDLKQLDKKTAERILLQVEETLSREPYGGQQLHGEFSGLYKMRVGDYRVIYTIIKGTVLVLRLRHRGKAYE